MKSKIDFFMKPATSAGVRVLAVLLFLHGTCFVARAGEDKKPGATGILKEYSERLPLMRAQLPAITEVAETVAKMRLGTASSAIGVTYKEQAGFANELMSRAGGLSDMGGAKAKGDITNYILISCIRSWEKDKDKLGPKLAKAKESGQKIILFASKKGMPAGFPVDYLIDNGDTSGSADHEALNAIVNISNAWIWSCEYTAALTRGGKRPGVLKSTSFPDGSEFNGTVRANKTGLFDFDQKIPAGKLGKLYLDRLDKMVADLSGETIQSQITKAAEIAAARINAGKPVSVATCVHFLPDEIHLDLKSPIKPFRPYKGGFEKNLAKGDLLIWMAYIGMNTANYDHGADIEKAGADLIACYSIDSDPSKNAKNVLVVIPQPWELGDAEIPIPFPPGKMAPVSAVIQALEFRALDSAIVARLKK